MRNSWRICILDARKKITNRLTDESDAFDDRNLSILMKNYADPASNVNLFVIVFLFSEWTKKNGTKLFFFGAEALSSAF